MTKNNIVNKIPILVAFFFLVLVAPFFLGFTNKKTGQFFCHLSLAIHMYNINMPKADKTKPGVAAETARKPVVKKRLAAAKAQPAKAADKLEHLEQQKLKVEQLLEKEKNKKQKKETKEKQKEILSYFGEKKKKVKVKNAFLKMQIS